jgi:hypothetical protein
VQPRPAQPRVPVHASLGGKPGGDGGRTGSEASAQQAAGTRSGVSVWVLQRHVRR